MSRCARKCTSAACASSAITSCARRSMARCKTDDHSRVVARAAKATAYRTTSSVANSARSSAQSTASASASETSARSTVHALSNICRRPSSVSVHQNIVRSAPRCLNNFSANQEARCNRWLTGSGICEPPLDGGPPPRGKRSAEAARCTALGRLAATTRHALGEGPQAVGVFDGHAPTCPLRPC